MKVLKSCLWLLCPLFCLAQHQPNFEIKGTVKDVNVSSVYIVILNGMTQEIDSAKVVGGTFTLRGYVGTGQQSILMSYNFKARKTPDVLGMIPIFLAPEKFTVAHDGAFNKITISGSVANDEFNELKRQVLPYQAKLNSYRANIYQLQKNRDTSAAEKVYAEQEQYENEVKDKVYGAYIKRNPSSPVAFYTLNQLAGGGHHVDGAKLKPYFDLLPQNIRESEDGQMLSKRISDDITFNTHGAIGSHAPNFTLLDTAGRPVHLSDYKGKYVLVDFWANWCTPCRADNPHLVAAYNQFSKNGFTILSVSLDLRARQAAWLRAIDHDHLTRWTHVADLDKDQNTAAALLGVAAVPQNFLIDPTGKIIGRSLREGALEKEFSAIFNQQE